MSKLAKLQEEKLEQLKLLSSAGRVQLEEALAPETETAPISHLHERSSRQKSWRHRRLPKRGKGSFQNRCEDRSFVGNALGDPRLRQK